MTLCSLADRYKSFGWWCCLHLIPWRHFGFIMLVEQALFIINVNFSYGDAAVIHFSVCFPLNILPVTKSKIDNLPRLDIRHIFTFQKIHLLKKILDQTYSCLITHSTLLKWQEFKFYCKTYVVH